jgi:hypothetical protein
VTVSRIAVVCWIVFGVMSVVFLPVAVGILLITAIPQAPRIALAIIVTGGLWWGPFVYAIYLTTSVLPNGDQRLVKRGIKGSADVLQAKPSDEYSSGRAFGGESFRIYDYQLLVDVPGKNPYMTYCRIGAPRIDETARVPVAVSRFNKKRVTIDFTRDLPVDQQAAGLGPGVAIADWPSPVDLPNTAWAAGGSPTADANRLSNLERLAELHRQGALTDAEFATEKARLLAQ